MASLVGGIYLAFSMNCMLSMYFQVGEAFVENQREFDYFVLALQWPGTCCRFTHSCCSSNACCRGSLSLTEFTIHGLWPDYSDGTWPACCSRSDFDINKLSPLLEALNKYWPSLSCHASSVCHGGKGIFWAHEWEKHGTCSYPVIMDEFSYFSKTLDLYLKHNVTKILNDAGCITGSTTKYPLSDIIEKVKNAFGSSPLLVCSHGSVEELRLCFQKDFMPRDCPGVAGTLKEVNPMSSCPRLVALPEYMPFFSGEITTI